MPGIHHDLQHIRTWLCGLLACALTLPNNTQALQHIRREDVVRGLADTSEQATKVARSAVSLAERFALLLCLVISLGREWCFKHHVSSVQCCGGWPDVHGLCRQR